MKDSIKFYMFPLSPWSYLSMERIYNLGKAFNISIDMKPIDLFFIFEKNNIKKVFERPESIQNNRLRELNRWSNFLNIPIKIEPKYFPVNHIKSTNIIMAATIIFDFEKSYDFAISVCKALWEEDKDISNENVLFSIAEKFGEKKTLRTLMNSKRIKNKLEKNTKEALGQDLFGVPSFVYKKELFWGQDRIFFLEEKIKNKND